MQSTNRFEQFIEVDKHVVVDLEYEIRVETILYKSKPRLYFARKPFVVVGTTKTDNVCIFVVYGFLDLLRIPVQNHIRTPNLFDPR